MLVDVVAHDKDSQNRDTKSIGFLELLYVLDKRYSRKF